MYVADGNWCLSSFWVIPYRLLYKYLVDHVTLSNVKATDFQGVLKFLIRFPW